MLNYHQFQALESLTSIRHAGIVTGMSSFDEHKDSLGGISDRELNLLSEVHRQPEASQREIARRVGIALGMTNLLLHSLAQKGYIRINKAGWRRLLYTLTPDGVTHKMRLTLSYIHRFLDHYRKVRQTLGEELETQSLNAESRIAIYGVGEFAELIYLALKELGIDEVDIYAKDGPASGKFLGMTVKQMASFEPNDYDRILIASAGGADQHIRFLLESGISREKVVTFFNDAKSSTTV